MRVKETKKMSMKWSVMFKGPEGDRDNVDERDILRLCNVLADNGIEYSREKSILDGISIRFEATFQQMSHLADELDLNMTDLRVYVYKERHVE